MLKLDNKGQTLVMFVIIIPILLFILILVYDIGNAIYEKNRLSNINYMTVEYGLENIDRTDENELIDIIMKNCNDLSDISVLINNEVVDVKLSKKIKGNFGKLFNYSLVEINSEYKGIISDKKIERIK